MKHRAAFLRLIALVAVALAPAEAVAQDYGTATPPPKPAAAVPLTPEQAAALHAVEVRIGGLEALVAKIDDAEYKTAVVAAVQDMKKRRAALEKNFDQGLYETLIHSVISRYQVVALWLAPPRLPASAAKPAAERKPVPAPEKTKQARGD